MLKLSNLVSWATKEPVRKESLTSNSLLRLMVLSLSASAAAGVWEMFEGAWGTYEGADDGAGILDDGVSGLDGGFFKWMR